MIRRVGKSYRSKLKDKADALFRLYIKKRDKWTCQRCGKKYPTGSRLLDCSHYFNRRYLKVRWDPTNADSLCSSLTKKNCHHVWEKLRKEAYTEFKMKQLGEEVFQSLKQRAYSVKYTLTEQDIISIMSDLI